jgi:hypothetical protein
VLMKRTILALTFIFALMFSFLAGPKAVEFDYGEFEGLPYTPPVVTLLSPSANESYNVSDVSLNVTVEVRSIILHNLERVRWLNYSLDGETAVPLTLVEPSLDDISQLPYFVFGNSMLTGLCDGSHSLTIFGKTSVSGLNGYFNETVYFNVNTAKSTGEPSPTVSPLPEHSFATILVIASVVVVAVVCMGLFIYFKKCKH